MMAKLLLPATKPRIIEIDLLRGTAVAAMVLYHLLYDLTYLTQLSDHLTVNSTYFIQTLPVLVLAQLVRIIFVTLVGISLWLAYTKNATNFVSKQVKRAFVILTCALAITVLTRLFEPNYSIRFGILHLIGVSILLTLPLVKIPQLSFIAGVLIATIGWGFNSFFVTQTNFPILGIIPSSTPALDYFPLIPWFGLVLIGIGVGNALYGLQPTSRLSVSSNHVLARSTSFLSRHALLIYLLHQPILLALIFGLVRLFKLVSLYYNQ